MRRLLWFVLFWTTLAAAQVVGPGFVDYVTSAPSGACSQGAHQQNVLGNGNIYTCQSGTWGLAGGGSAGVTARSAGASFTIQIGAILASNPACVSYFIVN